MRDSPKWKKAKGKMNNLCLCPPFLRSCLGSSSPFLLKLFIYLFFMNLHLVKLMVKGVFFFFFAATSHKPWLLWLVYYVKNWVDVVLLGFSAHYWNFYQVGCIFSEGRDLDRKRVKEVILNAKQYDVQVAISVELILMFFLKKSIVSLLIRLSH